ncbi:MAG: redoxin domain-containing protein [Acidimicrobiia bacterium]
MPAEVDRPAPDFSLRDQERNVVSLEDLKGRKSLIVFIPFAFTRVCQSELCAIRDRITDLEARGANVVAITCNTVHSNKRWSEDQGFGFPVLSDFWLHGATAQAYGCFDDTFGYTKRYTYVLDESGVVREIVKSDELGQAREFEAYLAALARL